MSDDQQKRGMAVRREVLGEEYVNAAEARRSAFNTDFQDLLTRYAWGEIWTRPGLDRRTRSLLTIAMLVALNRTEELELHLRASKNTGVSADEVKELLLQAAVYCGVPAANSAFRLANKILFEDV